MSTFIHKPQSLIERKKQQWAREKEELSRLRTPWGKDCVQSRSRQLAHANSHSDLLSRPDVNRRPSLPPIHQNPNSPYDENERDFGGETSGYGSDNPNQTSEERMWKDSLSNRWENKSEVKTFWESTDDYSKISDAPGWLKRGLQRNTELIVANSSSPSESPEQDYKHDFEHDRPSTSSSISQARSFIRGQNIPLDPVEIAEREEKRQRALAHQEAIKQQLEERERKKREEKERKLREELEEELRLEREKEIEKRRLEKEQQAIKEKQEKEQKRKQAMKEALELAQKEAEERKKQKSQNHKIRKDSINEKVENGDDTGKGESNKETSEKNDTTHADTSKENEQATEVNNTKCEMKESNPCEKINSASTPRPETAAKSMQTPRYLENYMMMPTSVENLNPFQFAVLMPAIPAGTPTVMPFAIPVSALSEDKSPQRTVNRVLTPSTYRQKRFCDSSTQTDSSYLNDSRKARKDSAQNRLRTYEASSRRGSRICTSDSLNLSDRPKWGANRSHIRYQKQSEKDPFYQRRKSRMKRSQSRTYEGKNNRYSPHSSDDSETASANIYSNNELIKKRTRALWQKNDNSFNRTNLLKTEIIPLETHNDQIYYKIPNCEKCFCRCHIGNNNNNNNNVEILRIEHDTKDILNCKVDNLNNVASEILQTTNKEISEKLTNTFQNELTLKNENDKSCCSSGKNEHIPP